MELDLLHVLDISYSILWTFADSITSKHHNWGRCTNGSLDNSPFRARYTTLTNPQSWENTY
eukprot:7323542-Heterocapsa_arctica.AAC.1